MADTRGPRGDGEFCLVNQGPETKFVAKFQNFIIFRKFLNSLILRIDWTNIMYGRFKISFCSVTRCHY